jgi:hypothetical protein
MYTKNIEQKEQIQNAPGFYEEVNNILLALEGLYAELEYYNILTEITGNQAIEANRNIYNENTVRQALAKQGLPDVFDLLFEEPRVRRPGWCRLRTKESILAYLKGQTPSQKAVTQNIPADQLEQIGKIFRDMTNRQVNINKDKIRYVTTSMEKQLVNLLIDRANAHKMFFTSIGGQKLTTENLNRQQSAFIHAVMRFHKFLRNKNSPYTQVSPHNKALIIKWVVYYENIHFLPKIMSDYGPDMYLDQKLQLAGHNISIADLFFEQINALECLPRLSIGEEQRKAYNNYFKQKTKDAPEIMKEIYQKIYEEFKSYLQEIRSLRKEEEFEKLKIKERRQLKIDLTNYAQLFCVLKDRDRLQNGLDYSLLKEFLLQTNFTEKGKAYDIRGEISDMFRKIYTYAGPDKTEYKLPVPNENNLLKILDLAKNPLPQNIAGFFQIKYNANTGLDKIQASSCQELLALYCAFLYPASFEKYKVWYAEQQAKKKAALEKPDTFIYDIIEIDFKDFLDKP